MMKIKKQNQQELEGNSNNINNDLTSWDDSSIHLVRDVLPTALFITLSLSLVIPAIFYLSELIPIIYYQNMKHTVIYTNKIYWLKGNNQIKEVVLLVIKLMMGLFGLIFTFYHHIIATQIKSNKSNIKINPFKNNLISTGQMQIADKSELIRPSPMFWKMILICSYLYLGLLNLVFLLPKQHVHQYLNLWDIRLGNTIEYLDYTDNCDLNIKNVLDKSDIFVLAHFFGWLFKAFVLRDIWIMLICSFIWEIIEYSLVFQLPNFAECWWDHWILDFSLCNFIGSIIGLYCCFKWKCQQYDWRGIYNKQSNEKWLDFTTFFQGPKTIKDYLLTITIIFLTSTCELCAFYLKYLLSIPPEHPWNVYRLILMFFMGVPANKQAYNYFKGHSSKRLGTQAQVFLLISFMEILLCFLYSINEFTHLTAPTWVKLLATSTVGFIFVYPLKYLKF